MSGHADRFFNDPNRGMAQLIQQGHRQERAMLIDPRGAPITQDTAVPVKSGQSVIRKASFIRQPTPKNYDAYSIVTGVDANNFQFDTTINENSTLTSGIIIGGKMTRKNPVAANVWFRLWLYLGDPNVSGTQTPPALLDGTPFNIGWSKRDIRIGYLDFNTFEAGMDCAESPAYVSVGQSLLFELTNGTIFGRLETRSQIAMAASEEVDMYLYISAEL